MAVPKHKRFRRAGLRLTPTPALVLRASPVHPELLRPLQSLVGHVPSWQAWGVGPFSRPTSPAPHPALGASLRVFGAAPVDTLLISEVGFFFRAYYLRSFSHLIDSHWFWSSAGYTKFTRWFFWVGLSFFVRASHPVAFRRAYFMRYGLMSLGVLYHFRRYAFFRDTGFFPFPYKRTLRLLSFVHSPVL